MNGYEIFWPLLAHALLVFVLYALLGLRRARCVKAGLIEREQFRENRDEPVESLMVRNCIANQFELPVLFYAVSILLFVTEADNIPSLILACIFVLSRYVHAYVHVTSNRLLYRSGAFLIGFLALAGMWGWLAVWMLFS